MAAAPSAARIPIRALAVAATDNGHRVAATDHGRRDWPPSIGRAKHVMATRRARTSGIWKRSPPARDGRAGARRGRIHE